MELRQLEYFIAVAQDASFTRAAGRLHVVQSAVSAAISALEKDLGAVLFDRNAQRVRLTDAGTALLPEAHAVLDAARVARDVVEGHSNGVRGTIRIGVLADLGLVDIPGLAHDFRARHPGVEIHLREAAASPPAAGRGSAGMLAALASYDIDLAFAGSAGSLPVDFSGRELLRVPQQLAVPAEHRLADQGSVGVAQLANEAFIDLPEGFAMRSVADQVFRAYGIKRQIAAEVGGIDAIAAFVRAGVGVAILPPYATARYSDLHSVTVREHDFRWSLNAVVLRRRPVTAATAALLELVEAHLVDQPDVERVAHERAAPRHDRFDGAITGRP